MQRAVALLCAFLMAALGALAFSSCAAPPEPVLPTPTPGADLQALLGDFKIVSLTAREASMELAGEEVQGIDLCIAYTMPGELESAYRDERIEIGLVYPAAYADAMGASGTGISAIGLGAASGTLVMSVYPPHGAQDELTALLRGGHSFTVRAKLGDAAAEYFVETEQP